MSIKQLKTNQLNNVSGGLSSTNNFQVDDNICFLQCTSASGEQIHKKIVLSWEDCQSFAQKLSGNWWSMIRQLVEREGNSAAGYANLSCVNNLTRGGLRVNFSGLSWSTCKYLEKNIKDSEL